MSQILLLSNPGKRRKHKARRAKAKKSYRRRASAKKSSKRRRTSIRTYRRNPSVRNITGSIMPTVKGGFFGALGGLGNDLLYGYGKQYLPVVMQSGMGRHATKLLTAVLVGVAGNYVLKGRGQLLATGAATVVLHEALKEQIATFAPSLPLGAMDEPPGLLGYNSAMPVEGMGEYMQTGEYMTEGSNMGGGDDIDY
jgi:hypothetical protein